MADSRLAKNLGSFFESLSFESPKEYLPPSLSKLINSNYYSKDTYFSQEEIRKGLNSNNDNEIYIVLKFLVRTLTTKQAYDEVNQLFPHVIKNINSRNLKIRRLVYYILLRFSDQQPDISLLSINAIQKSLSDKNPTSRALAIRCLSGITVPAILPILTLSLKKTVKDSSPLVRSASAIAIVKCYRLDRAYNGSSETIGELLSDQGSLTSQLYAFLDILLSDNDSRVVGSAIVCFRTVFPGCFDLIHGKLSHLIEKLNYLDSYSVELLLDLLTDYALVFLPTTEAKATAKTDQPAVSTESATANATKSVDAPSPSASGISSTISGSPSSSASQVLHDLLLNLKFLLYSDSPNVILAISRCVSTLFPFALDDLQLFPTLLKFTHSSARSSFDQSHRKELFLEEIDHLISLGLVSNVTKPQLSHFVPLSEDSDLASRLKIKILFRLIDSDNFDYIFNELKFIIDDSDKPIQLRRYSLQRLNGILVSDLSADQLSEVITFFMAKLRTPNDDLVSENITGLRQLIQVDVGTYVDVLIKLAGKLVDTTLLAPVAQASIIWLLGEFSIRGEKDTGGNISTLRRYLPDLFRLLVGKFKEFDTLVKLEILHAISKLITNDIYEAKKADEQYIIEDNATFKLFNYVLQLTKYDHDVDLRDRSRLVGSILPNVVYVANDGVKSGQMNVDELLGDFEIRRQCEEKIEGIEFAVYMFQTDKPRPVLGIQKESETLKCLEEYHRVTKDRLDPAYLEYYDEVRAQGFELKDYSKYVKSISGGGERPVKVLSTHGISEDVHGVGETLPRGSNVSKYKLQTLDDFLGDDGAADSEGTSS
ncbi:DEKNAAC101589 [Brettanomyces naardenensis]|uniref:DEKNAAC101589 n=1 Tax=Brettanomyces naardenensis TaxID=13370 RepID=A0A448YIG5_BRENA|nr:DEKNAAC101589 [Brettanomyces naardenensis]